MKCPNCGAKLLNNANFCSICGFALSKNSASSDNSQKANDNQQRSPIATTCSSLLSSAKEKLCTAWVHLATFYKFSLIALGVVLILFLIAYCSRASFAIVCSVVQFISIVVAMLLRKGILRTTKKWLPYVVLIVCVLLIVANIRSYFWDRHPSGDHNGTYTTTTDSTTNENSIATTPGKVEHPTTTQPENAVVPTITQPVPTVSKTISMPFSDSEYVGKNQEVVSQTLMQAGFSSISFVEAPELEAADLSRKGEVCKITIEGIESFKKGDAIDRNADIEITYYAAKHIAAPITPQEAATIDLDELVNLIKDAGFLNVTVNIEEDIDPEFSDETIRNELSIDFSSLFDATETFPIDAEVKITSHRRMVKYKVTINIDFIPNWFFDKYGVDIKLNYSDLATLSHGEDNSYEVWLKPGKHTLKFKKTGWLKPEKEVTFTINGETNVTYKISCHEDSIHVEQIEFIDMGAIGENEAMVPASASDFKYDNYKDVERELTDAGFTNIKTSILYDIVWGWTSEGEVDSVTIAGKTDYSRGNIFTKDVEIVITYHMWEDDDPTRIKMAKDATDYEGKNYTDVEKAMKALGFSNIILEKTETSDTSHKEGEVYRITIDYEHFEVGDTYKLEDKVLIKYYHIIMPTETEDEPVYYSTNTEKTVRNGNSGVYVYKSKGGVYDIYWIIDFDEGYVYWFTDGNGDEHCDRLRIESGDLNSILIITYHDGDTQWSNGLHFKWKNQPDHLVMQDHNGFEYDYYPTNLRSALAIRNTKRIIDY